MKTGRSPKFKNQVLKMISARLPADLHSEFLEFCHTKEISLTDGLIQALESVLNESRGEIQEKILLKMREIEPAFQAPVWIPELRGSLSFSNKAFDSGLFDLVEQNKVFLSKHAYPGVMKKEEKGAMLTDKKGNCYCVAVRR